MHASTQLGFDHRVKAIAAERALLLNVEADFGEFVVAQRFRDELAVQTLTLIGGPVRAVRVCAVRRDPSIMMPRFAGDSKTKWLALASGGLFFFIVGCGHTEKQDGAFPKMPMNGTIEVSRAKGWPSHRVCVASEADSKKFIEYLMQRYPDGWARPHLFVTFAPTYKLRMANAEIHVSERGLVVYRGAKGKDVVGHELQPGESRALIDLVCGAAQNAAKAQQE